MPFVPARLAPILLLIASNVFMTFAWYGHLRHKSAPLLLAILVSWAIAFFEYCLQVPANRIGSGVMTTAQLKMNFRTSSMLSSLSVKPRKRPAIMPCSSGSSRENCTRLVGSSL